MDWGKLLAALAALVGQVLSLLREWQARNAGKREEAARQDMETVREIETAQEARQSVERVVVREPDRLRDDDGFRRPD